MNFKRWEVLWRNSQIAKITSEITLEIASESPSDPFGTHSAGSMLDPRRQMWCLC